MKTNIWVGMTMCLLLLVLPAAASDFTLDIFGNANEDDIINMQDVTYTELIILEYKDETQLADAKHDGDIDILDVTQIELIILGKEKELTFLDIFGEAETVNKPINRLVSMRVYGIRGTRILSARDLIVGIGWTAIVEQSKLFPELSKLPCVGCCIFEPCDYEMILNLKPDAIQTGLELRGNVGAEGLEQKREFKEKVPGIPLISLDMGSINKFLQGLRTLGYILDREDEAEEFKDWFEGQVNTIKARTEKLSEDDKPLVYYYRPGKPYQTIGKEYSSYEAIALAGGRNILDELGLSELPGLIELDAEAVIEQNPEFIIIQAQYWTIPSGYETDDPSNHIELRQELLNRPELANVDAIKNGHVYVMDSNILCDNYCSVVASAYLAKIFHQDLFEDVDPQAIHQEYVDEFCHIDFDVSEHGVFMYPSLEES